MIGGFFVLSSVVGILLVAFWVHSVEKKGAAADAIHKGIFGVKDDPLPEQPRKKPAPWLHDDADIDKEA